MKSHQYNGLRGGRICGLEDKVNKLNLLSKLFQRQIDKMVQIEH